MKTIKLFLLFLLVTKMSLSQHNSGFTQYSVNANGMVCSSGQPNIVGAGHVIAGYDPAASGSGPNFTIIKTDMAGQFTGSDFIGLYTLKNGSSSNCSGAISTPAACYGVTALDNYTSNVVYAACSTYDQGMLYSLVDNVGNITNTGYYLFPSYGGSPSKGLICKAPPGSSDYIIASSAQVSTDRLMFVLRIQSNGSIVWSKQYIISPAGSGYQITPFKMINSSNGSGDIIIAGTCNGAGGTDDGFLAGIDASSGNVSFFNEYDNGSTTDSIRGVSPVTGGLYGYALSGYSNANSATYVSWIMNTDASGATVNWSNTYQGNATTYNRTVRAVTSRFSATYSGWEHYGTMNTNDGIEVFKIDSTGNRFSITPNTNSEFLYNEDQISSGATNIDGTADIGFVDNGNNVTKGIHVYGTSNRMPEYIEMINAAFNGVAGKWGCGAVPCCDFNGNVALSAIPVTNVFAVTTGNTSPTISTSAGLSPCANYALSASLPTPSGINLTNCAYENTLQAAAIQSRLAHSTLSVSPPQPVEGIKIFPTLISQSEDLKLRSDFDGKAKISLVNILGEVLGAWDCSISGSDGNVIEMQTSKLNLAEGLYFANIDFNGKYFQQKIVVQKN